MTVEKSQPSNHSEVPSTHNGNADRKLFDCPGAAEYFRGLGATRASPKWVYTLMASGELPRIRIGKKFYVSKAALDQWLIRHERRAR